MQPKGDDELGLDPLHAEGKRSHWRGQYGCVAEGGGGGSTNTAPPADLGGRLHSGGAGGAPPGFVHLGEAGGESHVPTTLVILSECSAGM